MSRAVLPSSSPSAEAAPAPLSAVTVNGQGGSDEDLLWLSDVRKT